jgi:catechol 2,3-dioxygenase-like lactoylglutathione lyase family enzyme
MPIRAVSHIAVGVSDIDRSLTFYKDMLGLAVSYDGIEEFPQTGKLAPHRRRGVYLRWSEGADESFIVLDQHDRETRPSPREFFELGIHHFGFWVHNIDGIFTRCGARLPDYRRAM